VGFEKEYKSEKPLFVNENKNNTTFIKQHDENILKAELPQPNRNNRNKILT